jgi:hypothetical protein
MCVEMGARHARFLNSLSALWVIIPAQRTVTLSIYIIDALSHSPFNNKMRWAVQFRAHADPPRELNVRPAHCDIISVMRKFSHYIRHPTAAYMLQYIGVCAMRTTLITLKATPFICDRGNTSLSTTA